MSLQFVREGLHTTFIFLACLHFSIPCSLCFLVFASRACSSAFSIPPILHSYWKLIALTSNSRCCVFESEIQASYWRNKALPLFFFTDLPPWNRRSNPDVNKAITLPGLVRFVPMRLYCMKFPIVNRFLWKLPSNKTLLLRTQNFIKWVTGFLTGFLKSIAWLTLACFFGLESNFACGLNKHKWIAKSGYYLLVIVLGDFPRGWS